MKRASSALSHENLIGSVLLGRYRVVRELAKGGMGVVYLARAEGAVGFVKPVVIKLVLPEHASDERFLSMFVREAQILAQLRHPSVVDVLEFGEQDGAYVMVLEYVRGYHLGQWSRFLAMKQRKIPIEILLQIVIDVLDALHHAHNTTHPDGTSMRIVHRDVSPSNVLLDEDGRARLLDFGVARMRGGAADYQTQVKGFVGKLTYTAPELFGQAEASPRSDLYSCAVVLHEAILGRNVFRADSQAASMHRVMKHVPESVESARDDLPDELDPVLQKALAKDPEQRFEGAREFANALRKLQPEPESEVRSRLATLLRDDFNREMAEMLRLESLADRDDAWRRLSVRPRSAAGDEVESVSQVRVGGRPVHTGSGLAPPPPPIGATLPIPSAKRTTRSQQIEVPPAVLTATEAEVLAAPEVAVAASPHVAVAAPAPPTAAMAATPAAPQRGVMVAIALVGCLAGAAIVLPLLNKPAPPPAAPQFRVVTQHVASQPAPVATTAAPAPEPAAPEPAAPEPAAPEPAAQEPAAPELTRTPAPQPARTAKRSGPDAQSLTRAFRNQQPKIQACFAAHAVGLQGHPQMQVDFDLDARGKLSKVSVTPAALAKTALGACIEQVARATPFPAQGQPVSFGIPVTASRTAADR
jgi:serine/threonine protein kinase